MCKSSLRPVQRLIDNKIPAFQNQSFHMIQPGSQSPGTVERHCKISSTHNCDYFDATCFLSLDLTVSFNTEHDIEDSMPEFYAPMDSYGFALFAFVIDTDTNKSVPIALFSLANSGAGDFTLGSTGTSVPSNNQFTYDGEGGAISVEVDSYTAFPTIFRSSRGRALTYLIFGINWLMTLGSMITTFIIFHREGEVKDTFSFLSITVLLAIPTTRGLYPGSPPFGIYLGTHRTSKQRRSSSVG